MSNQWMRCNLSAAIYPFATALWGRSIIVPQFDQNYDRAAAQSTKEDKGIPQAFYMQNCFPTVQGYQGVGFDKTIVGLDGIDTFDTVFTLQYTSPNFAKLLWSPAGGMNYVYEAVENEWISRNPITGVQGNALITTSFVNGVTYTFYEKTNCYVYDTVAHAFNMQVLTALTINSVKGLCSANGYNIAWDDVNIAWSSATDPTDFTPDITTGAGGGAIQFAKGKIRFCVPISGGFMVYCEQNVVSATYSGNIRFPFIFAEVAGSGGCASPEQVSFTSNLAAHYAWTTAGFQQLTKASADVGFAEITDFLSALYFEDFDDVSLMFTDEYLAAPLNVKVSAIADRYIIVSYGVNLPIYTHAIVYDLALKRYGKIKLSHRKCFEWPAPNVFGTLTYGDLSAITYGALINATYGDLLTSVDTIEVARKNLAFLQGDGTVYIVNFDLKQANIGTGGLGETVPPPVLVLGKFQFERNYFIAHQQSGIENVKDGNAFDFYLLQTLDGKTFLPAVAPVLLTNSPMSKMYGKRLNGQNISAMFIGAFNLNSYMLQFTLGGQR